MRNLSRLLLVCLAACGAAAPGAAQPAAPAAPIVALAPLALPEALEDPESARALFEPLLARRLEAAGFALVPSAETAQAWEEARLAHGPFFDPLTGEERHERTRAARRAALRALAEARGAVAWLRPALEASMVSYERGKAAWDGVEESAAPSGAGELPALSLVVRLEDLAAEPVATGRGGLQLAAKYSMWSSKLGVVPREKLFQSEKKNAAAVERALEAPLAALAEGRGARTPPEPDPLAAQPQPTQPEPAWPTFAAGTRVALLRELRAVTGGAEVSDAVRTRYVDLVAARLRAAGYTPVEPAVYEAAFRLAAIEEGGIYEPWSGMVHPERLERALARARAHAAEHVPGAIVVRSVISLALAPFFNEGARWHGVSEPIADISVLKKMLVVSQGRAEALSFALFVEDAQGKQIHQGFGGIQLLEKLEHGRFARVPRNQLFADPARDERAVDLALAGFPTAPD
jgi:hypothetical protein